MGFEKEKRDRMPNPLLLEDRLNRQRARYNEAATPLIKMVTIPPV